MKSFEIPWIIEEQTLIKHTLLKKYIDPWMAILFSVQKKYNLPQQLLYFDGFCGPGTYYTNESKKEQCPGSPIIVAEVANKYIDKDANRSIIMHCIDKDPKCIEILNEKLNSYNKHSQEWKTHLSEFNDQINSILDNIDKTNLKNQPMFFFIDPFGYSGFPLATLQRIMNYPRAELFINFNIHDIIRFWEEKPFEDNFKNLFGTDKYKNAIDCTDKHQKYNFFTNLYIESLKSIGANFVMPFRVNTPNQSTRPKYYLIHASKDLLALKVMKDEMSRVSEMPYRFEAIGLIPDQMNLFDDPEKVTLHERINEYCLKLFPQKISYENIEDWAYSNTSGVKKTIKEALINLENTKDVIIFRAQRQKKTTVTNGAFVISKGR